jgi:hypothetical protein
LYSEPDGMMSMEIYFSRCDEVGINTPQ